MASGFLIGEQFLGRIRSTVDAHEGSVRKEEVYRIPTRFEGVDGESGGKPFRICTFTGDWSVGSQKVVTFKYKTSTPNTITATNVFEYVAGHAGTANCAIAKDGTAWFLVQADRSDKRFGEVSAAWNKGAIATVNRLYADGSEYDPPETFQAINQFATLAAPGAGDTRFVMCILVGTTWMLVAAEC